MRIPCSNDFFLLFHIQMQKLSAGGDCVRIQFQCGKRKRHADFLFLICNDPFIVWLSLWSLEMLLKHLPSILVSFLSHTKYFHCHSLQNLMNSTYCGIFLEFWFFSPLLEQNSWGRAKNYTHACWTTKTTAKEHTQKTKSNNNNSKISSQSPSANCAQLL